MGKCSVCHNDYANSFEVTTADGRRYTFDSMECAIHQLAPSCAHCGVRIVGHGIQGDEALFCCASCARHGGEHQAVDNTQKVPG